MNEIEHVILTIDVAPYTVTVVGVFLLVGNHGLFAGEMLEAVGVSTLDLHLVSNGVVRKKWKEEGTLKTLNKKTL